MSGKRTVRRYIVDQNCRNFVLALEVERIKAQSIEDCNNNES